MCARACATHTPPPHGKGCPAPRGSHPQGNPAGGLSPGLGGRTPFSGPRPPRGLACFGSVPRGPAGGLREPSSPWPGPWVRVAGHARGVGGTCTRRHLSVCTARPRLPARQAPLIPSGGCSETPRPVEHPRRPTPAKWAETWAQSYAMPPVPLTTLSPDCPRSPPRAWPHRGSRRHAATGRESRPFPSPLRPPPLFSRPGLTG